MSSPKTESSCPNYDSIRSELDLLSSQEEKKQISSLNMIAAANQAPSQILESLKNPFLNIVAEGYVGNRFHTGTQFYDKVENLGHKLARDIFGATYINLKPHSATQAVQAALLALRDEGRKKILAMDLTSGGHITHTRVTAFNKAMGFNFVGYGVDPSFELDFEAIRQRAKEHEVEIIIAGASAFPKSIDWEAFAEISREIDARLIADMSHYTGLIAAQVYPNPVSCSDISVASSSKTLPGPKGGIIMMAKKPDSKLCMEVDDAVNVGLQSEDLSNSIFSKVRSLSLVYHPQFIPYARTTIANAKHLSRYLVRCGIDVVGYDDLSNGTDSHMLLVNVRSYQKGLTGRAVASALARVGVYANRNLIPDDRLGPHVTSGIRLSTSALSIVGMKGAEMETVGEIIRDVLNTLATSGKRKDLNGSVVEKLRERVERLRSRFSSNILD